MVPAACALAVGCADTPLVTLAAPELGEFESVVVAVYENGQSAFAHLDLGSSTQMHRGEVDDDTQLRVELMGYRTRLRIPREPIRVAGPDEASVRLPQPDETIASEWVEGALTSWKVSQPRERPPIPTACPFAPRLVVLPYPNPTDWAVPRGKTVLFGDSVGRAFRLGRDGVATELDVQIPEGDQVRTMAQVGSSLVAGSQRGLYRVAELEDRIELSWIEGSDSPEHNWIAGTEAGGLDVFGLSWATGTFGRFRNGAWESLHEFGPPGLSLSARGSVLSRGPGRAHAVLGGSNVFVSVEGERVETTELGGVGLNSVGWAEGVGLIVGSQDGDFWVDGGAGLVPLRASKVFSLHVNALVQYQDGFLAAGAAGSFAWYRQSLGDFCPAQFVHPDTLKFLCVFDDQGVVGLGTRDEESEHATLVMLEPPGP